MRCREREKEPEWKGGSEWTNEWLRTDETWSSSRDCEWTEYAWSVLMFVYLTLNIYFWHSRSKYILTTLALSLYIYNTKSNEVCLCMCALKLISWHTALSLGLMRIQQQCNATHQRSAFNNSLSITGSVSLSLNALLWVWVWVCVLSPFLAHNQTLDTFIN